MTHYTTIEQSKKLLELGLSPESADMFYPPCVGNYSNYPELDFLGVIEESCLPCWSVGVLFKMLPEEFTTKNDIGEYTYRFRMPDKRTIEYGCYTNKFIDFWKPMISYASDDFLDACFEMICWLKENGKL